MSKTCIEITEDRLCKVTTENDLGVKINKYVDFQTVMQLLISASEENESISDSANIVSDILPGDSLISTIQVKEIPRSNSKWYVLLREQKPVDMKLTTYSSGEKSERTFKNVAMPKTLYAIKVCNNKCVSLRIGCVKNGSINNSTTIYKYPYSNVFDTRSVCLGGNMLNDFILSDLSNIVMIPEMFLSMPNNTDGYSGSNSSGFKYDELLECFEESTFDEDILVESYNTPTYESFINKLR